MVRLISGLAVALTLTGTAALTNVAHADYLSGSYSVSVSEGLSPGYGFDTTNSSPYSGTNTASAAFTYTGALNFSDTAPQNAGPSGDLNSAFGFSTSNISGYAGTGTVVQGSTPIANFTTLSNFLGSSGSATNYQYGSWYKIDLGIIAAGTILTIQHDDGISLYQGATKIGTTVSGATQAVTDVVDVAAKGDTFLYYSRQNGSPSVLNVAIPEPVTISIMGVGLLGLCFMRRRAS